MKPRITSFIAIPLLFRKYLLSVTALMLLAGCSIFAQDGSGPDKPPTKGQTNEKTTTEKSAKNRTKDAQEKTAAEKEKIKKLKEYDQIIIKRKSDDDKNTRVVIEIRDDEVFVDGKPIDDFANSDISVRIQRPKTFSLSGAPSPFRNQGGWTWADDEKPFLGVATTGSTDGAEVIEVSENSAAAKAGLKKGDIITKVNDQEIFDHEQLSEAIGKYEPGDEVKITYKRDGKESSATVTLGARPAISRDGATTIPRMGPNGRVPNAPMPPAITMPFDGGNWRELFKNFDRSGAKPRIGMKVQDTEDGNGVRVMEVDEGSTAEKSGVKEDDIITSFDGKPVNSAQELSGAARAARDKSTIKLQLKRKGKTQTLELKVPKELKTAEL